MPKRSTNYRASLLKVLKDPTEAAHYLNAAVEDSPEMARVVLDYIIEANSNPKPRTGPSEDAGVAPAQHQPGRPD